MEGKRLQDVTRSGLVAGSGFEDDYDAFILCSQIYHCTPKELEKVDEADIRKALIIYNEFMRKKQGK